MVRFTLWGSWSGGGGRCVVLGLFRRSLGVDVHKRPRSVGCWLAAKSVGHGQPAPLGKGRPPEQAERALKLKQIGATDLALRTGTFFGAGIVLSPTWHLARSRGWSRGCAVRVGTAHSTHSCVRPVALQLAPRASAFGQQQGPASFHSPTWHLARSRGWSRGRLSFVCRCVCVCVCVLVGWLVRAAGAVWSLW